MMPRRVLTRPFQHIQDIYHNEEVIYFGVRFSNKRFCEGALKKRIWMAKNALPDSPKAYLATYCSESWTINAACRRRIVVFEMAIENAIDPMSSKKNR